MNHLDNLLPPEPVLLTEEEELEFQRHYLVTRARLERQERERRRRQRMAAQNTDLSSDSEMEGLTNGVKGKMELTPAGSTPQELVKLDPAEGEYSS